MSELPSAPRSSLSVLHRLLALTKPYRLTLLLTIALALIIAPLAIARPKLLQVMVDDYVVRGDVSGMATIALLIGALLLLEVLLRYVFLYYTDWLEQMIVRNLRIRLFNHITRLQLAYFDRTPVGQSTTRTINDIEAINTVFSEGSITILADLLALTAVVAIMFQTSWKLALVVLSVFPLLLWGSYRFKEAVRQSYEKVRNHIAAMNSFLQERISGMRTVQIFNAEEQEAQKFRQINRAYTQANLRSILAYAIFFPVVDIISALSLGLLVWYGARGVLSEEVTIGALVAFPLYISMLYRPVRMLADKFNTLQMGLIAAERVFNLLESKNTTANEGKRIPERLRGEVVFDKVWFSYTGKMEEAVLKNVSFRVAPGDTLAIVGSTGSGKTTIISLLNRFYEIQAGHIRIDDCDVREYDVYALRRRMALVLQDPFLFSGTVLDNITLRDAHITEVQAIAAAKAIGAHEFILRLPGGYRYAVQERGQALSMGQRQLIAFVRALVFDPDILILDEATSSIDPETEGVIQYAIERLIARRTSIVIAHRLSTIRHAQHILVLERGEVREFGPPDALLAKEGGRYRELYEKQFVSSAL